MSWDRNPNIFPYFRNRLLRIIPALFVVVILSIFLLGPLVTKVTLREYFSSRETYFYLKNIFLNINYYLPGVFENNPHPKAVNGSLWSLPVEFTMYIIVCFLGFLKLNNKYITLLIFLALVYFTLNWDNITDTVYVYYGMELKSVIDTSVYFWCGAVIYKFKLNKHFNFENFTLCLLILIFSYQWEYLYRVLLLFILPFLVLSFGLSLPNKLVIFQKADYSYGIYIYAFPIQQGLYYYFPEKTLFFHLFSGAFITFICAFISWHFVEKPFLSLKSK